MKLSPYSFIILAVLALPVSTAFLKLINSCLNKHAEMMFADEGIEQPNINIGHPALWCTIWIALLIAYIKSITLGAFFFNSLFLLGLLFITYIDIKYQYIFDNVVLSLSVIALLATPYIDYSIWERVLGVLAGGLIMFIIAVCARGMLGGGDIKMVAMLGLWQGVYALPSFLFISFTSAALFAIIAIIARKKTMRDTIAFGPYLALGSFIYWLGILR